MKTVMLLLGLYWLISINGTSQTIIYKYSDTTWLVPNDSIRQELTTTVMDATHLHDSAAVRRVLERKFEKPFELNDVYVRYKKDSGYVSFKSLSQTAAANLVRLPGNIINAKGNFFRYYADDNKLNPYDYVNLLPRVYPTEEFTTFDELQLQLYVSKDNKMRVWVCKQLPVEVNPGIRIPNLPGGIFAYDVEHQFLKRSGTLVDKTVLQEDLIFIH